MDILGKFIFKDYFLKIFIRKSEHEEGEREKQAPR